MSNAADLTNNPYGVDPLLSERAFRLARFGAMAGQLAGQKVALYGVGANAEDVVEAFCDQLDIVCLIDGAAASMSLWGYRVLGLDEALAVGIDVIVVAAKVPSALAVARRIAESCRVHKARLIDLYGNDLLQLLTQPCSLASCSLEAAVAAHEVVCADVSRLFAKTLDAWALNELDGGAYRAFVERLVREATRQHKKVVLMGEGQLSREEAERALGPVNDVLSTDAWGVTKENGIYRVLAAHHPQSRIMHVGSDPVRDGLMARVFGIDGYAMGCDSAGSAPLEMPGQAAAPGRSAHSAADHALLEAIGCLSAHARTREERLRLFGRLALGPLVVGYLSWLAREAVDEGVECIVFSARDGWIMRRLYERYRQACPTLGWLPSVYLPVSRKAALKCLLDDPAFCALLPQTFPGVSAHDLLCEVIGLPEDAAAGVSSDSNNEARQRAVCENADLIAQVARSTREGLLRHMAGLGLTAEAPFVFSDFVALGTCQLLLARATLYDLRGRYVAAGRGDCQIRKGNPCGYLEGYDEHLLQRYLDVEVFMTSPEPSVAGFESDGTVVFGHDTRSEQDLADIHCVHEGMEELLEAFLAQPSCTEGHISPVLAAMLFEAHDDPHVKLARCDDMRYVPAPAPPAAPAARTVRSVLFDLLAAFDHVCQKHNLTYIATHGTLLGAVREGDLIAWDDDMDLAMPRADYDRLCQLAGQGAFKEPYFLQTPENDPGCFTGGYARLRDSSTTALEPSRAKQPGNQGMWIDIMPLDNCPRHDGAVERQQRIVRQWQRILFAQTYGMDMYKLWDVDPRKLSAYFVAADHLSRAALCRHLRRACMACKPTGQLGIFAANYRYQANRVRYEAADIAAATRVPFGPTTIPVMRHAETWLARRYGPSWREVARPQEGETTHDVRLDPNRSYRDTLAQEADSHA